MTDDTESILREAWDAHKGNWKDFSQFVAGLRVISYRSGFEQGTKVKAIDCIQMLINGLKS